MDHTWGKRRSHEDGVSKSGFEPKSPCARTSSQSDTKSEHVERPKGVGHAACVPSKAIARNQPASASDRRVSHAHGIRRCSGAQYPVTRTPSPVDDLSVMSHGPGYFTKGI